ncbi:MAG: murein biosynthesis integral membrane protein MurJ [Candidatus Moranbacteria bacterium]|nr:murein biosynthesis integral membrane protein MurJ [Candidatus Moranbacteria bacterium]
MSIISFFREKLINGSPIHSVAGAALVVSVMGILSRLLGLFRDRILAAKFGAGDELDVYYAAFRMPDLIYNLLVVGALSAAFIPVFTGLVTKEKEKEAWKLTSSLMTFQVISIVFISILFSIFAPQVMKIITPGFSGEKLDEVVRFTRIMFLSPVFLGVSAIFGGVLVSFKRFLVYSIAPIMYNIGIIIGALLFVDRWGTIGLAWGVILGAVLHMLIQYPAVKMSGFRYILNPRKFLKDRNLNKVFRLMVPRSLAVGVTQINLLVITIFASTLASGSLAIFNFANNIQSVPLGLFGISFSMAAFPILSASVASGDRKKFVHVFSKTFRRVLFFVIPASVFIFMLRAEIVRIVFGAGEFDWEDTEATLWVLGFLSISLFAQSLIPLLARSFYALENTKIPFYIALFSEAVNILCVVLLIKKFEVMGLALAFSISTIVNMGLLFYFLRRFFGGLDDKKIIDSVSKIILGSIFSGMMIYVTRHFLGNFIDLNTFMEVFSQFSISVVVGSLSFIAACYWLRIKEFHDFKSSILVKIFGFDSEDNLS